MVRAAAWARSSAPELLVPPQGYRRAGGLRGSDREQRAISAIALSPPGISQDCLVPAYEEPIVGKVVTQAEELVIYKTLSERTATVRETVRETRVNVEQPKAKAKPPAEITAELDAEFQAAAGDKPRELTVVEGQAKRD